MDRASDSGSEGWGFESLPAYQKIRGRLTSLPLIFSPSGREGLEQFNATVRWTVAADGSTEAILYFCPNWAEMHTSPFRRTKKDGYFDRVTVLIVFALKNLIFGVFLTL